MFVFQEINDHETAVASIIGGAGNNNVSLVVWLLAAEIIVPVADQFHSPLSVSYVAGMCCRHRPR